MPPAEERPFRLVLFFTRGVSLRAWDKAGLLDREVALYRRLVEQGVDVSFITYGRDDDLQYASRLEGIRILCNRSGLHRRLYDNLIPLLHAGALKNCDLIKTNQSNGAELALKAARFWRKPLVARCGYMWSLNAAREEGEGSPTARRARAIESLVFRRADRVVVTTAQMAADIAARVDGAGPKTAIIPNYVDTGLFAPLPASHQDLDIISVGRLSREKNHAALLEAVSRLKVKLMIVGRGELGEELRNRFGDLDGRVIWQDSVPHADLPALLNRAKLFILPSFYEGSPKALLEAMACGRPVIGANSPGIREVINHRLTGYLCGTSAGEIRAAVKEVLGDGAVMEIMGRNARNFAQDNFSLDHVLKRELELYSQAAGRPATRPGPG